MDRQFKSLPYFPVKAAAADGRIRKGICAVFGNVDAWGDRIIPGAFRKTISEGRRRTKHLWNHSFANPPTAKIVELKELNREDLPEDVLKYAPEATGGLMVARDYYKNNDLSNWILEAIDNDDIDEMSFAYEVVDSTTSDEEGGKKIRNLTELKLIDTSDVLWGMNPATVAAGAKFLHPMPIGVIVQQLQDLTAEIKAGRRNAGTDEEIINAIHQASVDLGSTKCLGLKEDEDEDEPKSEEAVAVHQDTALSPEWMKIREFEISNFLSI